MYYTKRIWNTNYQNFKNSKIFEKADLYIKNNTLSHNTPSPQTVSDRGISKTCFDKNVRLKFEPVKRGKQQLL